MNWRSRACKIIDFIHFDVKRMRYIMPEEFEITAPYKMRDIPASACEEIIDAQYFMT